jgi:hypothetical protein
MKGDFSRFTFDPKKNYNRVLLQQGRVVLDADWNEQGDIQKYIRDTEAVDVVGRCGGPIDIAGFKVEVAPGGLDLTLSSGRMYVDGILCELDEERKIQPVIEDEAAGRYLAYLDVWDRQITAVEDDDIREKALGGPDTATRAKTEWLVKLKRCDLEEVSCREASLRLKDLTDPGDSRLAVRLQPPQKDSAADPCEILSGTAYRGLENQLYRVEIHEPGEVGEATFKWSRNNGAIAFGIVDLIEDEIEDEGSQIAESSNECHRVKLKQLGWDQELRIHKDDWVEVLGDETELLGFPGTLARVEDIDEADLILILTADVAKHMNESNPKVRRWDLNESGLEESLLIKGIPTVAEFEDETESGNGGWIELEEGIEVSFKAGDIYRTGDFWLIPARNTGEIEWPHQENDFVPKFGIHHHNCLLAILSNMEGTWKIERDCRKLFPPLADMVFLSYVGGDGQEAMPGYELPGPFRVRVTRGSYPVEGAKVNFKIDGKKGKLREVSGGTDEIELDLTTDENGIAECFCKLDENAAIEAELIEPNPTDQSPIWFNANVSVAEQVAYSPPRECLQLEGVETVRDAINGLCRQVSFSCVGGDGQEAMPGYELPGPFRVRVTRGSYPVTGAKVKFKIDPAKGELRTTSGGAGEAELEVSTDEDGIATCFCRLDENAAIEAKLIKPTPTDQKPIIFNANVSVAEEVAYRPPGECLQLGGAVTVGDAINGLCRQVSFSSAGGDGQEAMPGIELPGPLRVRVARGSYPVTGAKVKFKIDPEKGELRTTSGGAGEAELEVSTDEDGIATCFCRLDKNAAIEAKLMEPTPTDQSTIRFYANVSVAGRVAYDPASCPNLGRARTVQAAIDGLCRLIPAETARTVWVHGNSLQIYNLEGDLSVKRQGSGAVVSGVKGSKALIHLSIPTTQAPANDMPIAHEVLIRLKSSSKSVIRAASVYDGETMIFEAVELEAPTSWETIRIGPIDKPISTGVGISIQIEVDERVSQIEFSAAGCQFSAKR